MKPDTLHARIVSALADTNPAYPLPEDDLQALCGCGMKALGRALYALLQARHIAYREVYPDGALPYRAYWLSDPDAPAPVGPPAAQPSPPAAPPSPPPAPAAHARPGRPYQDQRSPRPSTTVRKCLCCNRPFNSQGAHNRLCGTCRTKSVGPYDQY